MIKCLFVQANFFGSIPIYKRGKHFFHNISSFAISFSLLSLQSLTANFKNYLHHLKACQKRQDLEVSNDSDANLISILNTYL